MINLNTVKTVGYFAVTGMGVAVSLLSVCKAYKCAKALKCMHDVDKFCEKEGSPESRCIVTTNNNKTDEKTVIRKHLYKSLIIYALLGLCAAYSAGSGLYIARGMLSNPICYGSLILGAVLFGAVNWFINRKGEKRGVSSIIDDTLNFYSFGRYAMKHDWKITGGSDDE